MDQEQPAHNQLSCTTFLPGHHPSSSRGLPKIDPTAQIQIEAAVGLKKVDISLG
jgi:hypothetical protein